MSRRAGTLGAAFSICRFRISRPTPPKRAEAMRQARQILDKAQRKFLFEFRN